MLPLSAVAILEKNKLSSDGAWLVLLEVELKNISSGNPGGESIIIRAVRNNEDIHWNGQDWVAFPFQLEEIGESSKGELPQVGVKISNITRLMQQYVETASGGIGSIVTVRVVHSSQVKTASREGPYYTETATPEIELVFAVTSTTCDAEWVTFVLGLEHPAMIRFPQKRVLKDWCHYANYKDIECGATSPLTTCNRTLADCRERGNAARFGGFPAIPMGGFYA